MIGARIPPEMIAPISQGISARVMPASLPLGCVSFTRVMPVPLPRYRNEARKTGAISPNNNFEMGALAPKNIAASRACKMKGNVADFVMGTIKKKPDKYLSGFLKTKESKSCVRSGYVEGLK